MTFAARFRNALKSTARELNRALVHFEPTDGDKTYPERMVSYYYIQAIARALPRSSVLLEQPVSGKRTRKSDNQRKQDNHIDALVFNDREVVAAEFKRGWAPSHWEHLALDLERLRGPIAQEILNRFRDGKRRRAFILLGADCWHLEKAEAWKSGARSGKWQWNLPKPMLSADRDYLRVYDEKGTDYDGYYFTWASIPFDWLSKK